MQLADLAWPDVDARALLAVPLGSTEQHGPHLPFTTDTDVALALCDGLAAQRTDAVVAPALPYGSSGEHQAFAGTLSIGQAALEHVLVELGRSATETFARVLLVSAHGGNAEAVTRAVATLRGESRDVQAFFPRWDGDPHAGHVETSLLRHLRPEAVDMTRAEPGDTRPLASMLPLLRTGGVAAASANGVLGDPSSATAADGAALLDGLVADLVAFAADVFPAGARCGGDGAGTRGEPSQLFPADARPPAPEPGTSGESPGATADAGAW